MQSSSRPKTAGAPSHASSRNQPLDILRGIAILLVLGYHYRGYDLTWGFGLTGVDLFFVLSGFLISGLLFKEYKRTRTLNVPRFLGRRGFKIYPLFYTFMIFTAVFYLISDGYVPHALLRDCFFYSNYLQGVWPLVWSLSVEEHFYLVLPMALLCMIRFSKNRDNPFSGIPGAFAVIAVVCLSLRIYQLRNATPPIPVPVQTHLRIDSLFCGVLLGYLLHFKPYCFEHLATKWCGKLGPALLVVAFAMPKTKFPFLIAIWFTVLYLGYGGVVAWSFYQPQSDRLAARALAWVGRYSYSIYLWNGPIMVSPLNSHPGLVFLPLYMAGSIGVGVAMSHLVEIPHLKLREKILPSKSSGPFRAFPLSDSAIGASVDSQAKPYSEIASSLSVSNAS